MFSIVYMSHEGLGQAWDRGAHWTLVFRLVFGHWLIIVDIDSAGGDVGERLAGSIYHDHRFEPHSGRRTDQVFQVLGLFAVL